MALRSRGKEITVELHVGGALRGSFAVSSSCSFRARQEIKATQFNGEKVERLDLDHMGWEGDLEYHKSDELAQTVLDSIVTAEESGSAQPHISLVWTESYRGGGSAVSYVFEPMVLAHDGESGAGADYVTTKWKWQAEKRQRIA